MRGGCLEPQKRSAPGGLAGRGVPRTHQPTRFLKEGRDRRSAARVGLGLVVGLQYRHRRRRRVAVECEQGNNQDFTVEPFRPALRHVVRPVGKEMGRAERRQCRRRPHQPGRPAGPDRGGVRGGRRPRHDRMAHPGLGVRAERPRPDRRGQAGRGQVRQPDQLLQAVQLQPAHQQVLRLLPHLDARPGRLPEGPVDEGRPAQRPPDLRRSPHRRHGDRPQAARAHGHRHVTRGGLQHGRPGAHLVLWRQHPGRAGEGRPELAGDGRRRRLHGEAVQADHDRRGVQLDRRLQQPGPGRRPALLHPQLDLRLPDRADDQRERRRRHLLRARAQGADREGHRQPARRPQLHRPQVGGERRQGQEVPAGPGGSGAQLRVQLGTVRLPRLPQHRRGRGVARLAAETIPSGRSPRTSSRCWPPPSSGRRTSGTRARPTRRKEKSSPPISSRP